MKIGYSNPYGNYASPLQDKHKANHLASIPENNEFIPLDLPVIQIGFDQSSPTSVHTNLFLNSSDSPTNVTETKETRPLQPKKISNKTGRPSKMAATLQSQNPCHRSENVADLFGNSLKTSSSGTSHSTIKYATGPATKNSAESYPNIDAPHPRPQSPSLRLENNCQEPAPQEGIFFFEE